MYWEVGVRKLHQVLELHHPGSGPNSSSAPPAAAAAAASSPPPPRQQQQQQQQSPTPPLHIFGMDVVADLEYCIRISLDDRYSKEIKDEYRRKVRSFVRSFVC